MAQIDVIINVDQGRATVHELLVIAPPGFRFPSPSCGDMCVPGAPLGSDDRMTARIASPNGAPLAILQGLRIRVITPERTPNNIIWYVEGRRSGQITTGWGQGDGFLIQQMLGAGLRYPSVPNLRRVQMTFTFELEISAGSAVVVEAPDSYLLSCSEGGLKQISLPGGAPQCTDSPLLLELDTTFSSGEFAFSVVADLPPETPYPNLFNIIVQDRDANVVDAAYGIPGLPMVPLYASSPTLESDRAIPGRTLTVGVGISFDRESSGVKALLITFPDNFLHAIENPTDVQNLNKQFPVASSQEWADASRGDRLKIYVDESRDNVTIPPGVYKWTFPVLMPCCTDLEMPRNNVWLLSICSDPDCWDPDDSTIIITFPQAGFSQEAPRASIAGAQRSSPLGWRTWRGSHVLAPLALALVSLVCQF